MLRERPIHDDSPFHDFEQEANVDSTVQEAGKRSTPDLGRKKTKARNYVNEKAQRKRKEPEKIKEIPTVSVSSTPM